MIATITIWILLSFSDTSHNRGTATVVGTFTTAASCAEARDFIHDKVSSAKAICVPAQNLVSK